MSLRVQRRSPQRASCCSRTVRRTPPSPGSFSPLVNRRSYADPDTGLRARTFFLNKELKQHLASGLVEYCPWRYGVIDRWLAEPQRFDTALIMVSPPDERGRCSLGVQADFLPSFFQRIERVVGFINPRLPRTTGDTLVDYSALTAVVDYDVPLVSLRTRDPDVTADRHCQAHY